MPTRIIKLIDERVKTIKRPGTLRKATRSSSERIYQKDQSDMHDYYLIEVDD